MKNRVTNLYNFFLYVSFIWIISFVLFVRWFVPNDKLLLYTYLLISSFIITYNFIVNFKKINIKNIIKKNYFIIILVIYIFINLLYTNNNKYFKSELLYYNLVPLLVFFTFFEFKKNKTLFNDKTIYFLFWFFNCYQIINIVIMILQIFFHGFMINNHWNNPLYLDQITGLIGSDGTHRLGIFFVSILYFDTLFFKNNDKKYRKFSKVFFFIILLFSLLISFFNDNKFYFFYLIMFFIPTIISFFRKVKFKNKKIFVLLICCAIIFLLALGLVFIIKFKDILMYTLHNGDERFNLFKYAISNSNPFIGKGIGSIIFLYDPTMPHNFGMSEFSSRVYTGGLIYLLLIILSVSQIVWNYVNNIKFKYKLFIIFSFLFLCYYSCIFSMLDTTTFVCLLYFILMMVYNNIFDKFDDKIKKENIIESNYNNCNNKLKIKNIRKYRVNGFQKRKIKVKKIKKNNFNVKK